MFVLTKLTKKQSYELPFTKIGCVSYRLSDAKVIHIRYTLAVFTRCSVVGSTSTTKVLSTVICALLTYPVARFSK